MTKRRLDCKVAIVTGAAGGMGRGYALHLAKLGADVAVFDKDLEAGKRTGEYAADSVAQEIRDLGQRAVAVQADLSRRAEAQAAVERAARELGSIDLIVNNAGGAITPAAQSYATNSPGGSIINIVTFGAFAGDSHGKYAVYAGAKAALLTYARHLAVELGPVGIGANWIAPGLIHTPRVAAAAAARGMGTEDQAAGIPLRRFGKVEDMVGAVEFLGSDMSNYITGECIRVTGGLGLISI